MLLLCGVFAVVLGSGLSCSAPKTQTCRIRCNFVSDKSQFALNYKEDNDSHPLVEREGPT